MAAFASAPRQPARVRIAAALVRAAAAVCSVSQALGGHQPTDDPSSAARELTVTVDLGRTHTVPATVIGVELEGVGHSIYGGGLYSQLIFDESFEDPRDDPRTPVPPPPPPPPPGPAAPAVSLRSVGISGATMRHCNAVLYATPEGFPPDDDYRFRVVPGLSGKASAVSLQSVNFPTYYVAPIDGEGPGAPVGGTGRLGVVNGDRNPAQPAGFASDASFDRVAGLANASCFTFVAADGRVVAAAANLTGPCAQHYPKAASAGVWLLPEGEVGTERATWCVVEGGPPSPPPPPPLPHVPHWRYTGAASISQFEPFNGLCSLNLTCRAEAEAGPERSARVADASAVPCASATNMNVYRRGISLQAGKEYTGYVFLRNHRGEAVTVTVALLRGPPCDGAASCTLASSSLNLPAGANWTRFKFTLTPLSGDPTGAFDVSVAEPGASIGVDMAFLEPGDWGRYQGMHLRSDVVDRLLLNGALRSIRLDGTSVVANPNYLWEHMRGPAWLRPPRYGDCWYRYMSNGFGIFDVLELAERANLSFVTVGVNVRSETPVSMADFAEYCFANETASKLGALRAADGHPKPFDPAAVVVELGNEESAPDYSSKAVPIAAAMTQRLRLVAPSAASKLRFALAFNTWEKNWTLAADMVSAVTGGGGSGSSGVGRSSALATSAQLTWDQHDGGGLGSVDESFASHDRLVAWLRTVGWTAPTPMYIGETNCAVSREACVGMARALTYGRYTNTAVRKGYVGSVSPAVWAYSTCDAEGTVCGASDGRADWPQAAIIITPNGTVAQPSWYAHRMVGARWGDTAVAVTTPNASTTACGSGGVVDVAVLRNGTDPSIAVHVVSTCAEPVNLTVAFAAVGARACGGGDAVSGTVLAGKGGGASTVNSVADPFNVVPRPLEGAEVDGEGRVRVALPPNALAVLSVCVREG